MSTNSKIHEGEHLNTYLKKTPWFLISSLTTKAMGFLLIPLLTYYLSPEEFGTLSTIESIGRLLPIFMALYLDSAFNRFYFKEKDVSPSRVTSLYSTHFWFILFWGAGVGVLFLVLYPFLLSDLSGINFLPIFALTVAQLLNQLAVMVTMIWNAKLLAKRLALFQVAMSLIAVFITWYLLVIDNVGWESRLYALFIVSVTQLSILLYFAIKNSWLTFNFDLKILKRSLKFSTPLIPNIAAGWIALSSDRLIMAYFGQLDQVGLYSVAAQIAIIMYVFNDAITKVQSPIAMSGLTEDIDTAKRNMASFITGYFTLMSIVYFLLSLFSRELLFYFTEEPFHSAYQIVIIIGVAYFCSGVYRVFVNIISFHGATWNLSLAAVIQVLVNITLNFIFIPIYGMYAAAISTVLSTVVYTLWIYHRAQKLDKIDVQYRAIFKILMLLVLGVICSVLLNISYDVSIKLIVSKLILFALFFIMLCKLNSSEKLRELLSSLFVFIRKKSNF